MTSGGSYNILRCYFILNALVLNGRITTGFFVPHSASTKRSGPVERLRSNNHGKFYYYHGEDHDQSSGLGYCYTNAHTSALFMARGASGDHWTAGSNLRPTAFQQETNDYRSQDGSGMSSGSYSAGDRSDYRNSNSGYSSYDRGGGGGSMGNSYGYPSSNRQYDLEYGPSRRREGAYSDGSYNNGGSRGDYDSRRGDDGVGFGRSRNRYGDGDSRQYGGGGREFNNRRYDGDRSYNNYNMDDRRHYDGGRGYSGEGRMYGGDISQRRGRRGRNRFFGSWFDSGTGGKEDDYQRYEGGMGGRYQRRKPSTKRIAFTALSCYLINNVIGTVPMFVYLLISNAVNTKTFNERLRNGGRVSAKKIMTRLLIGNIISCTYAAWGWFLASRQAYMPPLARGRWKTFTVLYWIFFYITGKVRRSKDSRYMIADAFGDRMSFSSATKASKFITMTLSGIAMVSGVYLAALLTGIPVWGTKTSGIWPQAISFIATLFLFR